MNYTEKARAYTTLRLPEAIGENVEDKKMMTLNTITMILDML